MSETDIMTKQKRSKSKTRTSSFDEEEPLADDSDKSLSKARFDQLLKQAVEESTKDTKSGKKKKKKVDESVLDKLRKGEGLRKDEDQTRIANTYDPDDIKGEKSNKRRQKEKEENDEKENKKGHTNLAYEDETESPRRKKKTKKSTTIEKDATIEELAPPPVKKREKKKINKEPEDDGALSPSTMDEQEVYTGQEKSTKKKKKKVKKTTESEQELVPSEDPDKSVDELEQSADLMSDSTIGQEKSTKKKKRKVKRTTESEQELVPSESVDEREQSADLMSDSTEGQTKVKRKKKKVKSKRQEDAETAEEPEAGTATQEEEEEPPREVEDEGRVIGVIIHRTDKLKTDFYISHPLVRVHIIDTDTGSHLKKQHKDRAVSSYYEKDNEKVDFILPIMTFPFDFKQNKSILPVWEETLIFNENYNFILQQTPNVVMFFELLDFVSINTARVKYNRDKQEGGWHRIAWAFLKVVGATGAPNTDRKVRLQLYQPPSRFRSKPGQVEVYQWWKAGHRVAYPSTMYVTVKGIVLPPTVTPAARSLFATQAEQGQISYDEMQKTLDLGPSKRRDSVRHHNPSLWSRLQGQVCKVPNALHFTLPVSRKGCFAISFSPDGRSLACACHDRDGYPIIIYNIPEGTMKGQMLGHYGLIYDLHWSRDSKLLLSASSDGTARVWDGKHVTQSPVKLLPHPAYVYTARFHVRVHKVVVTGSYDRIIRVWTLQGSDVHAELMQELDGHLGHINSVCFDSEGGLLYSGDSRGQIRIWNSYCTDQPSKKGVLKDWTKNGEINETEMDGTAINSMKLHPNGRRLLVHCRDNVIRMIDLRIQAIMQRYHGALNFREQIRSTISPCGTFIISGSEDSAAYVWNAEAGDRVASYKELGYKSPVTDVDFHPHEHMVAFCSYGENHPVLVYKYDHSVAQRDAGLETPVMMVSPRRTGRPASPEMLPEAAKLPTEPVDVKRNNLAAVKGEDFEMSTMARLDKVQRKLQTVTSTFQSGFGSEHPLGIQRTVSPTFGGTSMNMTYGSTFDSSAWYSQLPSDTETMAFMWAGEKRESNLPPSLFSPHAGRSSLQATMTQQQQLAAEADYRRAASSSANWRPGFNALGTQGTLQRPGSPPYGGRAPTISVNTAQGKPQFTFQTGPASRTVPQEQFWADTFKHTSSLLVPNAGNAVSSASGSRESLRSVSPHKVVALYDYQAQRSDELSLVRGDIISVLYKDNENWWMGELADGQQGFFPANYVTGQSDGKDKSDSNTDLLDEYKTDKDRSTKDDDEEDDINIRERMAAVISRTGELKIFSASATESDADAVTPKKLKKKKKAKINETSLSIENETGSTRKTSVRRKKKNTTIAEETDA